jgi:hypothetical protein
MGKDLAKFLHMVGLNEIHGQQHLEFGIESQEGLQQVSLSPENPEAWVGKVNFGILIGQADNGYGSRHRTSGGAGPPGKGNSHHCPFGLYVLNR